MTDPKKPPSEEEIIHMLESFQPEPGPRFQTRMERAPWRSGRARLRGWRKALAVTGIVSILVLAAAGLMPGTRAAAVKLFQFFQRAAADTQVVQVTPMGTNGPNLLASKEYFSLTIGEAESQAGFRVLVPGSLPDGFELTGARYEALTGAVSTLYSRSEALILVIQREAKTVDETGSIGASANVVEVEVRGVTGEYVQGGWRTLASTASPLEAADPGTAVSLGMEWDPELKQAILRWEENGFSFQIIASGLDEVDQRFMQSLANGLKD